jgi:hypothetical protein
MSVVTALAAPIHSTDVRERLVEALRLDLVARGRIIPWPRARPGHGRGHTAGVRS